MCFQPYGFVILCIIFAPFALLGIGLAIGVILSPYLAVIDAFKPRKPSVTPNGGITKEYADKP